MSDWRTSNDCWNYLNGYESCLFSFCTPFCRVIACPDFSLKLTGGDEVLSALISLATLVPYYLIIYMCRQKISRSFMFTLESIYN